MKVVLVVLIMMTVGEDKYNLENIVMEMKMEMNEQLALMEENLMKAQDDYAKNQEELKQTKLELLELKTKRMNLLRHARIITTKATTKNEDD